MTYLRRPGKVLAPGRAGVDHGGGALGDAGRVGGNAQRRDAVVNVNVNVDEARRDDLAAGVEHVQRFGCRNIGGDAHNLRSGNRDVTLLADAFRRVDQPAALDEEFVAVGRRALRLQQAGLARGEAANQRGTDGSLAQERSAAGGMRVRAHRLEIKTRARKRKLRRPKFSTRARRRGLWERTPAPAALSRQKPQRPVRASSGAGLRPAASTSGRRSSTPSRGRT